MQEPHIVLIKQPHVVDAESCHRDPFHAHAEGKAGILLRIDAAVREHERMHHAGTENLNPALALAETAALSAADKAGHIHLGGRLREREMVRTEADLRLLSEHALCKQLEDPFEIPHCDAVIDDEPLHLMENRRMVASAGSARYTRPGEITRIGGFCTSIVLTCTGDVWERSRMLSVI